MHRFLLLNTNHLFPEFTAAWEPNRYGVTLGCPFAKPWTPVIQLGRAAARCPTKTIRRIKEHNIQNICPFGIVFLQYYTLATNPFRNLGGWEQHQFII